MTLALFTAEQLPLAIDSADAQNTPPDLARDLGEA